MKNYIIIDKSIKDYNEGKNKNEDIALYSLIKLCSNFKSGISNITQDKLSKLTDVPIRTIQNFTQRMKKSGLITVETTQTGIKRHNTYKFNTKPENFFYLDTSFFKLEIDIKLKGLLLMIKSLCLNNSNVTNYNRTKIASILKQDRGTISKMINELIKLNLLQETDFGFVLPANYFPFYSKTKKSKHEYEKFNEYDEFVLESILEQCKHHHTILFVHDPNKLKLIFGKFPFQKKDIEGLDSEFINANYLPSILTNRCTSLPPKIDSLDYFLKALNIEYQKPKKNDTTITL